MSLTDRRDPARPDRRNRELLTPTETRQLLRVSRWTLWRLVRAGELAFYRVGGRKRFHVSEIRRLKNQANSVHPGADGCEPFRS